MALFFGCCTVGDSTQFSCCCLSSPAALRLNVAMFLKIALPFSSGFGDATVHFCRPPRRKPPCWSSATINCRSCNMRHWQLMQQRGRAKWIAPFGNTSARPSSWTLVVRSIWRITFGRSVQFKAAPLASRSARAIAAAVGVHDLSCLLHSNA